MANKTDLLLLFDHPTEPVFMDKGKEQAFFEIPDSYETDNYKKVSKNVQNRVGGDKNRVIFIKELPVPDLSIPMTLGRTDQFSVFLKSHRWQAGNLIEIFTKLPSFEELISVAVYAKDRINPALFNYALSVALAHRGDTKNLRLPTVSELFPDRFIDSQVIRTVSEQLFVLEGTPSPDPIIIPVNYTASDMDPEHSLWYFREDLGINLHHWHWHLVYPIEVTPGADKSIVDKDRRGELFYYMHQQVIARYNAERLSNYMGKVKALEDLDEPIAEGYFPKMNSLMASRAYPPRFNNTRLTSVDRPVNQLKVSVDDVKRWRDRIYQAIHQGFVVDVKNDKIALDEVKGIDILGNIVEASALSPNMALYGDMHNMGHILLAYSHDPDHRHLEAHGVMGDSTTAMRDPVFYRWHAFIDNVFQEHKRLLRPYEVEELNYPGIQVLKVEVNSKNQTNKLTTFWQQSQVNMSRGFDFLPRSNVLAQITHLQHVPFTYTINAVNSANAARFGYVRIFMAPKPNGRNVSSFLAEQRLAMIELDKFVVQLNPGLNTFVRRSTESSVTIPYERTFRNLDENTPAKNSPEEQESFFCGCGWPNHMLVPKGRPEGLPFELFVMISNYDNDRIDQDTVGGCNDAGSYCGIRDRKYPDRRSMGYPFDRMPQLNAVVLKDFLLPNMHTVDITITHEDRTEKRFE
ncbi:phenoloxidase 3-like [Drosophila eugracilis]|uniref:phenoloxidase 3-like n=1 Tax=Drosophila eugracilis TaxID=29029 RepID=UPI001BDA9FFF|nr:phenoloxidase 3-like [Drosophila eugracilis]